MIYPQLHRSPQSSGWMRKVVGILADITELGKLGAHSHALREIPGWGRVSPGTELYCVMGGAVQLRSLPPHCVYYSTFFSSNMLELLHLTLRLPQRCCHPWVIVKSDVLWGIMVENASCSLLTPHCNESISQVTSPGYACRLWHLGDGSVVSSVWRQLRAHILTVPPVGESLACLLLKSVFVSWQFIIMFCNFYVYYKYPFVF